MTLSNSQKIVYLSNVIGLARVDDTIAPKETNTIEIIQKAIGARKTELNAAYNSVERDPFVPQPVGSWADQIKNLEHILYLALVDGTFEGAEKKYVLDFAKKVRITQDQLNLLLKEVKQHINNSATAATCVNCKTKHDANAKFCPECGHNIDASYSAQSLSVSYDIPRTGLAIEFAESTAASFPLALQSLQKSPLSKECVRGKKRWFLAAWPTSQIADALDLVENLKGLRNRRVHLDGKEAQWNDIFGFSWCANNRKSAYRPNEYCFGLDEKRLKIWGCKQVNMDWNNWADWFSYGSFKKSGVLAKTTIFEFDKKRIRHELETNLYSCRLCPHLSFDLLEAVLDALPNEVSPSEKGEWRYKRDYSESPGAILVKEAIKEDGFSYVSEFYSSGVQPASVTVGLNILKAALQRCDIPGSHTKGILEYKE